MKEIPLRDRVAIVPIREEHINNFYRLFAEVAAEAKWLSRTEPFPLNETVAFIKNTIEKGIPFVVAVVDEEVIGWCDVQPKGDGDGLFAMGIKLEYREQGLGRIMLNRIIELSRAYGYKRICLEVRALNIRAYNLYVSVGFVETEYVKDGLLQNGVTYDYRKMILEL